jgi:hypothetical protein
MKVIQTSGRIHIQKEGFNSLCGRDFQKSKGATVRDGFKFEISCGACERLEKGYTESYDVTRNYPLDKVKL